MLISGNPVKYSAIFRISGNNYNNDIKSACLEALENFKGKKILIGRARMFEEKTKEYDDLGMFALSKLCEVF